MATQNTIPLTGNPSSGVLPTDPGPRPVHGLRHTYATLALEAGVPIEVVSKRLGHASIAITADLYQHVTKSVDRNAAEAVATPGT